MQQCDFFKKSSGVSIIDSFGWDQNLTLKQVKWPNDPKEPTSH